MKSKNNSGFTLVEISLVSFIFLALGSGFIGLQYILGNTQVNAINSFLSVEGGNSAVNQINRDLRKTRPGENGSYALVLAEDYRIIFYSDIDFDDQSEKVEYFLDGSDLRRSVIEPTGNPITYPQVDAKIKTIATNVQNQTTPIFFYLNADFPSDVINNPLITPANLLETKVVKIALIVNSDPQRPTQELVFESLVQLRTLKDNL